MAIERAQVLEHENAAARSELAALRAHPDTTPHPAELQLPELTLALRRASDKLTLAEEALHTRTSQLADVQGAAARAHHAAENAFALAAGARAREEEAVARERALMLRLRMGEEESKMMDRAVREYADLVRGLERRQGLPSSPPPSGMGASKRLSQEHEDSGPIDALQEEKAGLHKLVGEFVGENEALRDEIGRLQVELEGARAELEAEQKTAEQERVQLSHALTELELLKHDDNAAAKMVSRYMYAPPQSFLLSFPFTEHTSAGSSPRLQRTRYKSPLNHSKRATQQRRLRCIYRPRLRSTHLRSSSASLPACATYWKRQRRSSRARPMAGGVRSRCGSLLLDGRTSSWRLSGGGCAARKRRVQRRVCRWSSGLTLSSATRAIFSPSSMARPLVKLRPRTPIPASGAWRGSSPRGTR